MPTVNHAVPHLKGTKIESRIRRICNEVLTEALILSLAVYQEVSTARLPPSRKSAIHTNCTSSAPSERIHVLSQPGFSVVKKERSMIVNVGCVKYLQMYRIRRRLTIARNGDFYCFSPDIREDFSSRNGREEVLIESVLVSLRRSLVLEIKHPHTEGRDVSIKKIKIMSRKILCAIVAFLSLSGLAFATDAPQDTATYVKIVTNKGSVEVRLYDETPLHRDNFIRLVREKAYDKVIFHRVIKQFMVQAGGNVLKGDSLSATRLEEKHSELLPAEIVYPKYFHKYGALAAARTGDDVNPEKKSSSFQFYIVTGKCYLDSDLKRYEASKGLTFTDEIKEAYKMMGGTPHLDGNYTVFGEVVKGMNTVEKIQSVSTDGADQPVSPVYIKKVVILKKKKK